MAGRRALFVGSYPASNTHQAMQEMLTFAARAPEGSTFGLHLCFGDLNNEGRVDQAVARPSVTFTEMVAGSWPAGRSLAYVHIPLASGHVPPPLEPDIYAPLGELAAAVPPDVRIVAGIAHEAQSLGEQQKVLGLVEDALGRAADVAAACGLGRRTLGNARAVARRTMDLARTPI